jgi:hypothetical protein
MAERYRRAVKRAGAGATNPRKRVSINRHERGRNTARLASSHRDHLPLADLSVRGTARLTPVKSSFLPRDGSGAANYAREGATGGPRLTGYRSGYGSAAASPPLIVEYFPFPHDGHGGKCVVEPTWSS